jgi:hypothetical protein
MLNLVTIRPRSRPGDPLRNAAVAWGIAVLVTPNFKVGARRLSGTTCGMCHQEIGGSIIGHAHKHAREAAARATA